MTSVKQSSPDVHPKGWGHELWIRNCNLYCGKILVFLPKKKFSWHYHKVKDETFFVLEGELLLRFGYEDDLANSSCIELRPGAVFHVPPLLRHQLESITAAKVMEISTEHFEEDSIRIERGD